MKLSVFVPALAAGVISLSSAEASTFASTADATLVGGYSFYAVQSFTATENNISGFDVFISGTGTAGTIEVDLTIYSDAELTNALVTATDTEVSRSTFAEFTFDPVELIIGETYYLYVDPDDLLTVGTAWSDPYADGAIVKVGGGRLVPSADMIFNAFYDPEYGVEGDGDERPLPSIPLPASAWLLLGGVGILLGKRRKRETWNSKRRRQ